MDFFQAVVEEYLRSSRSRFVNSECLIRLHDATAFTKGTHWYCDFVTVDFAEKLVYLCEVSFARRLHALLKRLCAWSQVWADIASGLRRDCCVPPDWEVRIWVFIPEDLQTSFRARLDDLGLRHCAIMQAARITTLESILPWKYRSWNGTSYD